MVSSQPEPTDEAFDLSALRSLLCRTPASYPLSFFVDALTPDGSSAPTTLATSVAPRALQHLQAFTSALPLPLQREGMSTTLCLRSIAGRRYRHVLTSRSLRVFRLLAYLYRSRWHSVPFTEHRLLLPPHRGHNSQSHAQLRHILKTHSHLPRRPIPPGGFYRPVPHKLCGYGSVPGRWRR